MATECDATAEKEVSDVANKEPPKNEPAADADANSVPDQHARDNIEVPPNNEAGGSNNPEPRAQANVERRVRRSNRRNEARSRAGRQRRHRINRSTLLFDRVPDMFVRVSQPSSEPTVFELICTRIFVDPTRGDAPIIPTFEEFTLEHELLPGYQAFCATPNCNCNE